MRHSWFRSTYSWIPGVYIVPSRTPLLPDLTRSQSSLFPPLHNFEYPQILQNAFFRWHHSSRLVCRTSRCGYYYRGCSRSNVRIFLCRPSVCLRVAFSISIADTLLILSYSVLDDCLSLEKPLLAACATDDWDCMCTQANNVLTWVKFSWVRPVHLCDRV